MITITVNGIVITVSDDPILQAVARLEGKIDALAQAQETEFAKEEAFMSDARTAFNELAAQVEQTKSVEDSAVQVLNGVKAQIDALVEQLGDAPSAVELRGLSSALGTSATMLAAAVAANTPGAPPAP
jgi:hypothetical protein